MINMLYWPRLTVILGPGLRVVVCLIGGVL